MNLFKGQLFEGIPLSRAATRLFGSMIDPHIGYFDSLKNNLKRANIKIDIREYVSAMLLYSLIAFASSLTLCSAAASYFIAFAAGADPLYSYTLALILSFLFSGSVFILSYYYPSIKAKGLQTKIDRALPFAVFYMATSASSGIEPLEIFELLSKKGGVIGSEAGRIYNDVKALGMSLPNALQKAASRTPSILFADLLWGMLSVITTGGDIRMYLQGKAKTFMNQYRRALEKYAKQIAIYTEIYITLVIVGSLLFTVLLAIISPLSGGTTLVTQTLIVFVFLPSVSTAFILLLKAISPSEY